MRVNKEAVNFIITLYFRPSRVADIVLCIDTGFYSYNIDKNYKKCSFSYQFFDGVAKLYLRKYVEEIIVVNVDDET